MISDDSGFNYVPQERAAVITYYLMSGEVFTTREIAQLACMSMRGVRHIMDRISRVLPVYQDDDRWQMCK